MTAQNQLARSMARIDKLPALVARRARTLFLRNVVPFVGTARLEIVELTPSRAVVTVKNWKRVRNHIGSVHAAAMALIAETATGFVIGMNVPEGRTPVIKSMGVEYKKRAKGALRAEATLTPAQIDEILANEKGETKVSVVVTDEAGVEPIVCAMVWAWTPRRGPKA
jgi:acyl-coenzyme A thioesterase PaaI-like protein